MISTRDLTLLPDVTRLRELLQSLAMLDAILSPDWEYRYYSFNSRWSKGEQMGSMRDGQGDDFYAHFSRAGCFLKGFAHEARMTPYRRKGHTVWPGVLDKVPAEFKACLREPAFCMEDTTFCIWRMQDDAAWQRGTIRFPRGDDPDGSAALLTPLAGDPRAHRKWVMDYYEEAIPLAAVKHVFAHQPLTKDVVASINPDVTLRSLAADIREIGYPAR